MADEAKELLIRVSATTELLRSNLAQAERVVAGFERTTSASTARINDNFQRVGVSAGQQKAGLQQLGFQLQDVATQFASGTKASVIFAQQGGQVLQAVQLMSGGTSKFAQFMGGPWGIAISTATIALAPFISKLFDTEKALESVGDKARSAMAELRASLAGVSKFTEAIDSNVKSRIGALGELASVQRQIVVAQELANNPTLLAAGGEAGREAAVNRVNALNRQKASIEARIKEADAALAEVGNLANVASIQERNRALAGGGGSRSSGGSRTRSGGGGGARIRVAGGDTAAVTIETPQSVLDAMEASALKTGERLSDAYERGWVETMAQYSAESSTKVAQLYEEAALRAEERLAAVRENQTRTLAGLYESLFRGGTKALWDDFKNIGLSVIAQVMAKFTIAQVMGKKGGGFNLGGAISSAFGSILGFADGGRPPVGRVSMVGERGPELFVPDAAGTIIPNHALGGGGGPSIVINAPGATAETVSMIRREIRAAAPTLLEAASATTKRSLSRRRL